MKYVSTVGEQEFTIDINDDEHIIIDGEEFKIDFQGLAGTPLFSLIINCQSYDVNIDQGDDIYHVSLKGTLYDVKVEDERTRRLAGLKGSVAADVGEILIKAPMPGIVVATPVVAGQSVAKGDIVAILESMKMQNEFKAPRDGVISSVRAQAGDKVDQNTIMVTIS
ncbi:MAG TPA: biotin/lipoyl-binding protein [Anaerolineae bacterium]|nr:biotin/lipoyl-binding protein [Anaerolineae bacterium]